MTVVSGAVIRLSMPSRLPTPHLACVALVDGLDVDRIVDARVYRIAHPLCVGVLLFVLAY